MRPERSPTALIVTKDEQLGRLARDVLGGLELGFRCRRFRVDSHQKRRELLEVLAGTRFDFVVAQQQMSPYSALELLRDLNDIRRQDGVAVVCLADDDEGKNEFKAEGGEDFLVLKPAVESRRRRLSQCVREIRDFRAKQAASKTRVIARLERYSLEKDFRELTIDLFRELGFHGVRLTHGPNERGCDIVCWDVNRLARTEYVGIQVKLGDVSGSAGPGGVTTIFVNQAVEALTGKVAFPQGERALDIFIVMVSGLINQPARTKLSGFLSERGFRNRIVFLDREDIADLIVTSAQALLTPREWKS